MNEWTEVLIGVVFGAMLGVIVWRLITGKWIPDGSFSASHAPSGIDWNKVNQMLDKDEGLYKKNFE